MNLPQDAAKFLDCFRVLFHELGIGKGCTLPRIHVYGFSKAQDPEVDFHVRWLLMYRCTEFASLLQENGCCVHHSSCQRDLHSPEPEELRNREEDMQTRPF